MSKNQFIKVRILAAVIGGLVTALVFYLSSLIFKTLFKIKAANTAVRKGRVEEAYSFADEIEDLAGATLESVIKRFGSDTATETGPNNV